MPEIGECYSIAKILNKEVPSKVIEGKESPSFKQHVFKGKIHPKELKGTELFQIKPYGKSIWFFLKSKDAYFIMISQLGMSGSWFINDTMKERGHFHLQIKTENSWLKYSDPRMFGKVEIFKGSDLEIMKEEIIKKKKWGIDPMISSVKSITHKIQGMTKNSKTIKEKLLEQNLIFGIGNYLASEILFDAKIHPKRKSSSLSEEDINKLSESIKKWVHIALKAGGFSFAGGYILPDGSLGDLRSKIQVYQKEDQKCPHCKKNKIIKEFMAGRATFFCDHCQK